VNPDFDHQLNQYAEIIVKVGLNLQPGQRLLIGVPGALTPLEAAPLVRRVAARAYDAGARLVDVLWGDDELRRIRLEHAGQDTLSETPRWIYDATKDVVERGDARLVIYSENPDLFVGIDPQRTQAAAHAMIQALKPIVELNPSFTTNWLVIGYPVAAWAAKVFPGLPQDEQVSRLWQAIFSVCRADQPDPVAAWKEHARQLQERADWLTHRQYAGLHYSGPGTDLTIGLPPGHLWEGGGTTNQAGIFFIPNFPTEEIFTLPHRGQADGVVRVTRPFSFHGSRIEGAVLRFSEGRVVDYQAESGREALRSLLETDEGASRLGEAALVPNSSPVSSAGLLFYNELYDENASCHLALGRAYTSSLEGAGAMPKEAFAAAGGNISDVHNDFMIGSDELNIDGLTHDGRHEPLLRRGEWAFEL
jgi:aminopeptidase